MCHSSVSFLSNHSLEFVDVDVDQSEVYKESTCGRTDMSINMNKVDARGVHTSIFYVTTLGMGCIKEGLGEGDISGYMGKLDMLLLRNRQHWDAH